MSILQKTQVVKALDAGCGTCRQYNHQKCIFICIISFKFVILSDISVKYQQLREIANSKQINCQLNKLKIVGRFRAIKSDAKKQLFYKSGSKYRCHFKW